MANTELPTRARVTMVTAARARGILYQIKSVAVKGAHYFPSQRGDFSIVDNTALPARARG